MPNFTDSQISKWANNYERELCGRYHLILDRYSLATTAGVSEYELPNYITDIRMVLYLGKEVHPKGFRQSVMVGDTPFNTATNAPYEYFVGGKGMRVMKFFPTVMDTIASYGTGDTLFDPAADAAAVIIEHYRTPSVTDATRRLPSWLRRWIMKDYICAKAFLIEGPTQNLKGAEYYNKKLDGHDELFRDIEKGIHQTNHNILNDRPKRAMRKPGHPILPPNFGFPANY